MFTRVVRLIVIVRMVMMAMIILVVLSNDAGNGSTKDESRS